MRRERFVYLLHDGRRHKIGMSHSPHGRAGDLCARVVHCFPSENARGVEAALHWHYRAKRLHREWFNLDDADVETFRSVDRCDRPEDYPIPLEAKGPTRPLFGTLDVDTHRAFKQYCRDRGRTMASVIIEALERELADPRLPPPKRPRGRPRKGV